MLTKGRAPPPAYAQVVFEYRMPFMLFWQLYNNERTPTGAQKGYWLINDKNEKQPNYFVHQRFYEAGKAFVRRHQQANGGRVPSPQAFADQAQSILDGLVEEMGLANWYQVGQG